MQEKIKTLRKALQKLEVQRVRQLNADEEAQTFERYSGDPLSSRVVARRSKVLADALHSLGCVATSPRCARCSPRS